LLQTDEIQSLSSRIAKLEEQIAVLGSATQSSQMNINPISGGAQGLTTILADLRINGNGVVNGMLSVLTSISTPNLIVSDFANFFGDVVFNKNVQFKTPPTFDSNTGGIAIIKKGADRVNILFDKEYQNAPQVSALISFDNISSAGSTDENIALENQIKSENYSYFITRKTGQGFTIILNKPANEDISFSWIALSISSPKVSSIDLTPTPTIPVSTSSAAFQSVLNELNSSGSANQQ
jgi:hypothetical protein